MPRHRGGKGVESGPVGLAGLQVRQGGVNFCVVGVEVGALDLVGGFLLIQLIIGCLTGRHK